MADRQIIEWDADVVERVMQNVNTILRTIADDEYQKRKWAVDSCSASWETFGEQMSSLLDDCDAINLSQLPRESLKLGAQQYRRFQSLVRMLDGFTTSHQPIRLLRYEHLVKDASWKMIVKEAKKFVLDSSKRSE
jgi:hypothetical protein